MLPLVRVGAAVSADVVTSTKLFVMRYTLLIFSAVFTQFGYSMFFWSLQMNNQRNCE